MKFYIAEGNIGAGTTREFTDRVIQQLRARGWDVEYGVSRNRATDVSEFGQEEKLLEAFSDDFMRCIDELEAGLASDTPSQPSLN